MCESLFFMSMGWAVIFFSSTLNVKSLGTLSEIFFVAMFLADFGAKMIMCGKIEKLEKILKERKEDEK